MPDRTPPLRHEPLWVRVDRNRLKLGAFVALFVGGSAILLTAALVAVPGYLLSWGSGAFGYGDPALWYNRMPLVIIGSVLLMLLVGAVLAAIQLSNAEHWVRSRFEGRDPQPGETQRLESALHDMSLAAGLPAPPSLLVMDSETVNAFAIGTTRNRPAIGVTTGLLQLLDENEERAVVATLTARIVAGDIMFGTALAALMGPLKAVRGSAAVGGACCSEGCLSTPANGNCSGCGDGCVLPDAGDGCGDLDEGCGGFIVFALFLALVAAFTYAAVVTAAWIVTFWGLALQRTSYEKADAEGMLLLKDPGPMLSALGKAMTSSNEVLEGDPSYDGILYAPTSGRPNITRAERRRFRRLAEVLGVDGALAETRFSREAAESRPDGDSDESGL